MSDKAFPIIPKDGKVTIFDGAGSPLSYEVMYEDADFQGPELSEGLEDVQEFMDRDTVYAVRKVGRKPKNFTFTCHAMRFARDGSGNTHINDVVLKKKAWASATSTAESYSDAFMVKVVFEAERTDFGESSDTSITMLYCRLTAGFQEGAPGKFSISGTIYPFTENAITVS